MVGYTILRGNMNKLKKILFKKAELTLLETLNFILIGIILGINLSKIMGR